MAIQLWTPHRNSNAMRPYLDWMSENDIPILEFLDGHDVALSPRSLQHNLQTRAGTEIPYSTINYRLKQLLDHGFVEKEDTDAGLYGITERGRRYLSGDLTKEDLEA